MKVAITGHKPERIKGKETEIRRWLNQQIGELAANNGTLDCYSGMSKGVDQIFGFAALAGDHRLHCVYAYRGNENAVNKHLEKQSKSIIYVSNEYYDRVYQLRDKYMVDNCDVLLAVWDGIEQGGTWQTIKYAREQGKEIIYMMIA